MADVLHFAWHSVRDALLMAWQVGWALVFGFAISAVVQAWVPRARVERALGSAGPRAIATATALGAASSSCSWAAIAIARSLMAKGASAASALSFQFASTNLVWELGLVLWVLIGWQFTVAEYVGGVVMIALMALVFRAFVPRAVEDEARARLAEADRDSTGAGGDSGCAHHGHDHAHHDHAADDHGTAGPASSRVAVARAFLADWRMLWREIAIGFAIAGVIAQVPNGAFHVLLVTHAPAPLPAIENALVGPLIAVLSFVCSVGNVPLAAVLWSGGIGMSGVLAFLFADLLILPIIAVYRRTYGPRFTVRAVALMYVTMVVAALAVAAAFHGLGWVPTGRRPTRAGVFGAVKVDYTLVLNGVAAAAFAALAVVGRSSSTSASASASPSSTRTQSTGI